MATNAFTVFSKPWPEKSPSELAAFIKKLGFDGIELPVRPGYPVPPEDVTKGLPEAAKIFADNGVKIGSIAGPTDEPTIAACAEAGVPIIRVCAGVNRELGYLASEAQMRKGYDALVPILQQHGVTLGVQNHCGHSIGSAIGIMHFIEDYDPKAIGAVLDLGHCGLDGEPDDMAIDICWSHLVLVNLKSAYWERVDPDADDIRWKAIWTTGRLGITSWPTIADELKKRNYVGDICLTAEYTDSDGGHLRGADVDPLISQDITYARSLFEE